MNRPQIEIRNTPVNNLPVNPEKSLIPIQLTGDRVLIDPIAPDKFMDADKKIAKPVDFKEPYMKGIVVSIGGGEYGQTIPESMKVGLEVYYWHQQSTEFEIDGKKYQMVRSSDVFMYL